MLVEAPIVAVVDIGSATTHFLCAQVAPDGSLRILAEQSARTLLGSRRLPSGDVAAAAADDVLAALRQYRRMAEDLGAAPLLVVATEAIRAAPNGPSLVARWEAALDWPINVLTPSQETDLALRGAFAGALPASGLFADSGGGSTQVAAIAKGEVAWSRSLPLGAGSLTATYLASDPPTPEQLAEAGAAIRQAMLGLPPPPDQTVEPVVTGGSARLLSSLALGEHPPGVLTADYLAVAAATLERLPSERLAARYGLPAERARLLIAGCLIIRCLVRWSGSFAWRVSAAGLREGIVRAWTAQSDRWLPADEIR